ncbi:cytochrome b6-F complex subunit 5 [Gossypium australe]|uniref:Cytochrome b6-F complex subunit 5 n=3 Tax=Gossypium TaxID=3633 RepID=A0A5B6U9Y0_9ROSI|nr:cytochrome b6-F complex subunit 5 [Gossypium australe]
MAKLLGPLPNYTFIFLSCLLLVYSGTQMVEAQVCSRPSQTTGVITCPSNLLCDRRCRDIEGAMYGLIPITLARLFVTAYLQYKHGDQLDL